MLDLQVSGETTSALARTATFRTNLSISQGRFSAAEMFALNAVRRAAAVAVRAESRRTGATYTDICASPPTNRISFVEKCVHGVMLSIGLLGYPIYTMFEVAKVKQEEYDALEIPEEWQEWEARQEK